jgi:chromosomal replication initiator protein
VNTDLEHTWPRIQAKLAAAVDEATYRVWLEPLRPRESTGGSLVLEASPHAFAWISERFGRLLQTSAADVLGEGVTVDIVRCDPAPAGRDRSGRRLGPDRAAAARRDPDGRSPRGGGSFGSSAGPSAGSSVGPSGEPPSAPPDPAGNPRFTFDHFVIGDSNRLAHAAALAVAELPGQAYNPLFICGPPGVGKTHLLRSIAALLLEHTPSLSVRTGTGESFTNEFQSALLDGRMGTFKARFRHVDVLLIDDVQFLQRKARTEEEFFHTFNTLTEAGAQLVITSDRPPRDLDALEDRLRERFEAGLVADIRPPDLAVRLAILRKRVQQDDIPLADPAVLDTIARRVVDNVRALEGALIRIVAFGSLTGRPLSSGLAAEVLDNLCPYTPSKPRSLADIQAAACRHFGLSPEELLSPSRAARVAWPRQVAMYLSRELTEYSTTEVGAEFGGRDHTTVMHACQKIEDRMKLDPNIEPTLQTLLKRIKENNV